MSKITNEQIFELITGIQATVKDVQENQTGMQESIGGMQESIGGMQESIGGILEMQTEMKETQEKLMLAVVDDGVRLKALEDNYTDMAADVKEIKRMVEKDAKKQQDHEIEHTSNIAAHDRFEARIGVLEKSQ
jgi:hypothetical protein